MPVYNEGENIERNLDALFAALPAAEAEFRCIIVYDFDEDNTLPVIQRIAGKYSRPVELLRNRGRGVLEALKTGLFTSPADYVIVSMADLSDDYSVLPAMIEFGRRGYDIIIPSRYMKGGRLNGGPFFKQALSRIAGVSLHALCRIPTHDISNSFRMYRTEALKNIAIESTGGFEIGMEITAKIYLNGGRIVELPAQWWDRTEGRSKFRLFKWLPKYMKWYLFLIKGKWFGKKVKLNR